MVDVVRLADAVRKREQVIDRRKNIVNRDVLRHQLVTTGGQRTAECVLVLGVGRGSDLEQNVELHAFAQAQFFICIGKKFGRVNHFVGEHAHLLLRPILLVDGIDIGRPDAGVLKRLRILAGKELPLGEEHLAGNGRDGRTRERIAGDAAAQ